MGHPCQFPPPRRFSLLHGMTDAAARHIARLAARLAGPAKPADASARALQRCMAQRTSLALGCEVSIILLHENPALGQKAMAAAFAELERVERVMSIYQPDSQVSRLNRDGIIEKPDPYLFDVLEQSCAMSQTSGGAFDVTVQPLWKLYAAAKRAGGLPDARDIEATRRQVDWQGISVERRRIRLRQPGMQITLNGIAQGYAADRAMEALRRHGVSHALVNAGGEISSFGAKEKGKPWRVGIQHPRIEDAFLGLAELSGRCMTTSGDYASRFTDDGRHHHIFDPASGRSPQTLCSVSVVAPTAAAADALSTAIFVLGPEKGLQLVRSTAATDVLMVLKSGQTLATEGFPMSPPDDNGVD